MPGTFSRDWKQLLTPVLVLLAAALLFRSWLERPRFYASEETEIAATVYSVTDPAVCPERARPGPAGVSADEETARGFRYTVKTPSNYDATRAHPLIVVYAPRGMGRALVERYVGLTRAATRDGFVIAYSDSHELSIPTIEELARIPELIADKWCIDEGRVHLTGHSDGGTVATAATVLGKMRFRPVAIAPSAAGLRREDLSAYACPAPTSVMVMQNKSDTLFPGYGRGAAEWWAACNRCDSSKAQTRDDGCVAFPACSDGATTLFCEGEGTHEEWPGRNVAMLEFFRSSR